MFGPGGGSGGFATVYESKGSGIEKRFLDGRGESSAIDRSEDGGKREKIGPRLHVGGDFEFGVPS